MNKLNEVFSKIYVVSFEGSSRLQSLSDRLSGVDYEVVYGPNKNDLNRDDLIRQGYVAASPPINYPISVFACTFTHIEIYKKIREQKLSNVLILEDDNLMLTENLDYLVECHKNLPDDWDLFFIGLYNTNYDYKNILPRNYKNLMYKGDGIYPLEGSNAYAINNKFLDIVLPLQENPYTFRGPEYWSLFNRFNYFSLVEQVLPAIDTKNYKFNDGIIKITELGDRG
jgi:GR25 family glycosyltransferase involved in LPS biosynthesis